MFSNDQEGGVDRRSTGNCTNDKIRCSVKSVCATKSNFVSSPIINTRSRLMLQRNLMSMSYMCNVYSKLRLHDVEER